MIGTVLSAGVDLSSAPAGRLGLQELFNVHLHVANINAGGAFSLLDKQGIKRYVIHCLHIFNGETLDRTR